MGAAHCSKEVYLLAREVGELIGQQGAILICGGRSGVMEAAARGAKEAGGLTVGILPEDSDLGANPFIDIPIVTGQGNARNVINVLSSMSVIAISGGYGTLSEIALALKVQTPVVGLRTWSFTADPEPSDLNALFSYANTPKEAVDKAVALACHRSQA